MRLKRYCVTFSDNWTPIKYFWTLEGAKKVYRQHRGYSNVYVWNEYGWKMGGWEWLCGARDLEDCRAQSEDASGKRGE